MTETPDNPTPPTPTPGDATLIDVAALKEKIVDALRTVFDPEIPVNIYEMGLIYSVDVQPGNKVAIKMTLTSPACPAAQELPVEVQSRVARIREVSDVDVEVVWDPPWKPDMMSEVAKVELGMM